MEEKIWLRQEDLVAEIVRARKEEVGGDTRLLVVMVSTNVGVGVGRRGCDVEGGEGVPWRSSSSSSGSKSASNRLEVGRMVGGVG